MLRANYFFETKRTRRVSKGLAFGLAMMFALLLIGLQSATKPAHAATTFTVNSIGDENDLDFPGGVFDGSSDGKCDVDSSTAGNQCTLRAAIQQANKKKGKDTIAFNIPGNGPHNIPLGSLGLPTITKPVIIDGYTQGDATATEDDDAKENTIPLAKDGTNADLRIQLDGTNVTSGSRRGLAIDASNTVVKGLVINRFRWEGIRIDSGSNGNRVEGNFIGTDPSGTVDVGNGKEPVGAVAMAGVTVLGTNNTIGGASPEARNLISGNDDGGVAISGIDARGNKIEGNLIGTDRNGTDRNIGNTDHGVILSFSTTGNRILSNSIYSNNGLGINLNGGTQDTNGVTANDDTSTPPDSDTGPNRLQNYPVITRAFTGNPFGTGIDGTLKSTPSTTKKQRTFTIQFFSSPAADASGYGEGKTFIGQLTNVTTDRQGNASFSFAPAENVPAGEFVTATATNNKTGDTSEFSQAREIKEPGAEG